MKLDNVDVDILKILQEDGRASFRDIAKKVGVTTPTVSSKVNMYEQMGLIKGFAVRLDTDALGEISIILSAKSKPSDVPKVADELTELEEVREVYLLGGSWMQAKVTFKADKGAFIPAGKQSVTSPTNSSGETPDIRWKAPTTPGKYVIRLRSSPCVTAWLS